MNHIEWESQGQYEGTRVYIQVLFPCLWFTTFLNAFKNIVSLTRQYTTVDENEKQ